MSDVETAMDLDEFLALARERFPTPTSRWIEHDGFKVYLRANQPHGGLTLANVSRETPGSCKFWGMIATLRAMGPLIVESVVNARLATSLESRGAERIDLSGGPATYLLDATS